jgi:hypothetical protein
MQCGGKMERLRRTFEKKINRPYGELEYVEWLEKKLGTAFINGDSSKAHSVTFEPLVGPQCDHIVGVMPNDKPYYVKGDIRWTCSSDIKNATSEEKELYEKKLAKFKYCPICGEALSG